VALTTAGAAALTATQVAALDHGADRALEPMTWPPWARRSSPR
jgi:hypothetical protein